MNFLVGNVHVTRWTTFNCSIKTLSLPQTLYKQQDLNVANSRIPTVKAFGFRELGIHDVVSRSLEKAYPNIRRPTLAQAEFIPAILDGKDVLLQDATGTGKSFGVILSLLSKRRVMRRKQADSRQEAGGVTSLVIVPHRDLAFQMLHWIRSITSSSNPANLASFAQVVARDASDPTSAQITRLRETPPHVLLGTPQALLDIYASDASALQVDTLSTIYVDEVDHLIGVPAPYIRKSSEERAWRNFKKHPSVTRQLLDGILREHGSKTSGVQLVMSSATIHENLVEYLTEEGWLGDDYVYISGKKVAAKTSFAVERSSEQAQVFHHAIVVHGNAKPQNLQDIEFENNREEASGGHDSAATSLLQQKLETVATIFAMDVPNQALLVLPPSASVRDVVSKLQEFGVNAHPLDVRALDHEATEGPTLIVATPAHTRGVDLPLLSHVFVLGVPDIGDIDVFKHVAGRVDRFGNGGTVVVLLDEVQKAMKDGMMKITKNEPNLMKIFYRKLGVKPTKFDLDRIELQDE
ncbi:P-loop containing nucleoside triphosphate hydrolase protein [Schizopora paradoxa]|uniref:RNA helicase n=1 Tax=Schizopora paradoxa TaxID=27342 RepID=A0A0H2RBT5_9AGAM|nr:P-loop containing nucleoside triphosphate hydrolase protein [Schizopora paradoxa]